MDSKLSITWVSVVLLVIIFIAAPINLAATPSVPEGYRLSKKERVQIRRLSRSMYQKLKQDQISPVESVDAAAFDERFDVVKRDLAEAFVRDKLMKRARNSCRAKFLRKGIKPGRKKLKACVEAKFAGLFEGFGGADFSTLIDRLRGRTRACVEVSAYASAFASVSCYAQACATCGCGVLQCANAWSYGWAYGYGFGVARACIFGPTKPQTFSCAYACAYASAFATAHCWAEACLQCPEPGSIEYCGFAEAEATAEAEASACAYVCLFNPILRAAVPEVIEPGELCSVPTATPTSTPKPQPTVENPGGGGGSGGGEGGSGGNEGGSGGGMEEQV